jgi:hypothetical protein
MARTSSPPETSGGILAGEPAIARLARAVTAASGLARVDGQRMMLGRSYVVAKRLERWRVTYEDAPIGAFDDPADATRFACDVARIQAQAGVSTVVEVQAAVLEMHCFVLRGAGGARPPRAGG